MNDNNDNNNNSGSDVGKQKRIRIVVSGKFHRTISATYIVASARGKKKVSGSGKPSGRPRKSGTTTITTEDGTVEATANMCDSAAAM